MFFSADYLRRITWQCAHFVDADDGGRLSSELASSQLKAFTVDGSSVEREEQLFLAIANQMQFPGYFGMNWDALDECLRDMQWLPAEGYVLFVTSAESLWKRCPRIAGTFLELWLFAAEEWAREGKPFHLVFVW